MATDNFKQVLFNDGEGLTQDDLNNIQRYARAQLYDANLQYLIGATKRSIDPANLVLDPEYGGQNGTDVETRFCYCLSPGAAFLKQGSASNKVAIAPGVLLQKVGTTNGTEATLLSYHFTGAEEFTLTAGDGANPRVDLLQMKLEYISGNSESRDFEDAATRIVTSTTPNKARRVQCTLSVKAGTPAATPTIPEPDAGYVPVGSVVVGTSYLTATSPIFGVDTAGANAVVWDQRLPLRVRAYRVDPVMFKLVTAWALNNNNSSVISSNATNDFYVPYPGGLGRLVAVSVSTNNPFAGGLMRLGRSSDVVSTSFVEMNYPSFAGFSQENLTAMTLFEAQHRPAAGPTVSQSATTFIGAPLWTNGRRCPYQKQGLAASVGNAPGDILVLRIRSGTNAHTIAGVTFYVAEGI